MPLAPPVRGKWNFVLPLNICDKSVGSPALEYSIFFITLFRYFIKLFYYFYYISFPFLKGCRLEKGHIVPVLCSHSLEKINK